MMTIRQLRHIKTDEPLSAHFAENKRGLVLAIGVPGKFVVMRALRYEHDSDLVAKIAQLYGIDVRLTKTP